MKIPSSLGVRIAPLVCLLTLQAALLQVVACGGTNQTGVLAPAPQTLLSTPSPTAPDPPAPPAPPTPPTPPAPPPVQRAAITLSLSVRNTHYGTAIPADFKVSVFGGNPDPATFEGAATKVVHVDAGSAFSVKVVSGPDGYTETVTPACAGVAPAEGVSCAFSEADIDVTCDASLWRFVYAPVRLKVLAECKVAVGKVDGTQPERDGDLTVLIRPEAPYTSLLRPGNMSHRGGRLVTEVLCQGPITQKDAVGTCASYTGRQIVPPRDGQRIVVAGKWVEDKNHANWGELHPARILVLPR